MTTDKKIFRFQLKTIVFVLFTIILVVAGAVYEIVTLSIDDKNSALEVTINEKDNKIQQQEKKIKELEKLKNFSSVQPINATPELFTSEFDNPEVIKLKKQISVIEKERNELLIELVEKSYNNLEPNSELALLIKDLSSDSLQLRENALKGLVILRQPKSINALINYYFNNIEEATKLYYKWDWINLIIDLNYNAGLDFVLEMLKNKDTYLSYWAYDYLLDDIRDKEIMGLLIQKLNPIALNNPNSLVRTRSKILISNYKDIISGKKNFPDNRSRTRILLDIEQKIDELKK